MEIKACPFCGSKDVGASIDHDPYTEWEEHWFVVCFNCRSQGPEVDTKDEAIEYWNHSRSSDERIIA